jgi:hypothetical protein
MSNVIIHNTSGLELFKVKDLKPLQNDYKKLSLSGFNKLKKSIDEHGFSFSSKVWIDNGIIWIIGGHQRQKVLLKSYKTCTVVDYIVTEDRLVETSRTNYNEVMIPCEQVRAKNRKEAIELLLLDDSRFGDTNKDAEFFKDHDVSDIDFSAMSIDGIDIDLSEIEVDYDDDEYEEDDYSGGFSESLSEEEIEKLSGNKNNNKNENSFTPKDINKPDGDMKLSDVAKLKHGTKMINLSFRFPEEYFEVVEIALAKIPINTIGNPPEQEKRGKRLLRLLGINE